MQIKIKYQDSEIKRIEKIDAGDWLDLRCAQDTRLFAGKHGLIPLGVAMQLPSGYEALIAPRSSTFKNFGTLQTNSVGIIDNSYCGDNDWWFYSVYATKNLIVRKNDRICQFRIMKKQPSLEIVEVEVLGNPDRNGHGSSGIK